MIKKTKEQKGITLIALVITIIVLLILAGVTLSIVWNGGIIEKSQNAVDTYKNSSAVEQNQIENLAARFEALYNEREAAKDPNALINKVKIGDYITYDPTAGVENPETNDILKYTSPIGELKVYSGNNVYAMRGTANSNSTYYNKAYELINEDGNIVVNNGTILGTDNITYTVEVDSHGNGHSNQNFQAKPSNNLWRVLDDGSTTGVIKIIPENEIKTTENRLFNMRGLRGYKNAVTELNNISEIFGHGTGATGAKSITIEEVNVLTGYTPTAVTSGTNLTITKNGVSETKSWKSTQYKYQGTTYPGTSTEEKSIIYEMLIKRNNATARAYLVAFPCVAVSSTDADFRVASVYFGTVGALTKLWSVSGGDGNDYGGVLPVVTLESDLQYKDGNGTSDTPWTFQ